MDATWEKIIIVGQRCFLDPICHCLSGGRCSLKLYRLRCLLLHDYGAGGHAIAMADVSDPQANQITCSEFAVQAKIKKGQFPSPVPQLKSNANGSDVLEFQGRLLAHDLSFIPWDLGSGSGCFVHADLLELKGEQL